MNNLKFNQCLLIVPNLYPLETIEDLRFSDVYREYYETFTKEKHWAEMSEKA